MPDDALYFPYIEVPENPSLIRVLLYWDRLGTIVPVSLLHLSDRMEALVSTDLVERINPDEELWKIDGFAEGFLTLLDATPRGNTPGHIARIHGHKATWRLWDELRHRGVVRGKDALGWMEVDGDVARLYMAYLASCLGRQLGREPITDQRQALTGFASVTSGPNVELDRMRAVALANVLPAPSHPVPPTEIAAFKAKHWEKLRAFRIHVERRLLEHVGEPDREIRDRAIELTASELEEETREIEALMKPRWPSKRGMLCAGLAGTPAGAKTVVGGDPFDAAVAAAPMVVEIVDAFLGRPPEQLARSPLAYAALASKTFGDGDRQVAVRG